MARLYVGNLPYTTTEQELTDMFAASGKVLSTVIITDRQTGRSKGFGFVEFETDAEAQAAIQAQNGAKMGDRTLVVSIARPREERPAGGGYSGGRDFSRDRRGGFGGDRGHRGDRGR